MTRFAPIIAIRVLAHRVIDLQQGVSLMAETESSISINEKRAIQRLVTVAAGSDFPSPVIADFLLAWWDASRFGQFDLQRAQGVDEALLEDLVCLYGLVLRCRADPESLGFREALEAIAAKWRA